jgi:hypothetical protein
MFNVINSQISHFNQVDKSKNTRHSSHKSLVKMYISSDKERFVNQLGPFEKSWIVIVLTLIINLLNLIFNVKVGI